MTSATSATPTANCAADAQTGQEPKEREVPDTPPKSALKPVKAE